MKRVIWYLPSGAGGMAALYKANAIKQALRVWAGRHLPEITPDQELNYMTQNGLRYCYLCLVDEHATIFVLTWDNTLSKLQYEYIESLP